MVIVDLILAFCFYAAAALGFVGIMLPNTACMVIAFVVLGLICAVLIVTSFVLDSWVVRIINMSAVVLPIVTGLIVGGVSDISMATAVFYGLLAAWTLSVIVLGIVDCYDEPDTIMGTVFKKLLAAIFVIFAALGLMSKIDWAAIVSICGFVGMAAVMYIAAIVDDFSNSKSVLGGVVFSMLITVILSTYLFFVTDLVWWHFFSLVAGGIYLSVYFSITVISGETDGVTERICDIPNIFY